MIFPEELSLRLRTPPPTPEQELAIVAPMQPYAIVAGAGSGKTQTMGLRVAWLVANGHVEPTECWAHVHAEAAAELSLRVRRICAGLALRTIAIGSLDPRVAAQLATGEPTVSTYHAMPPRSGPSMPARRHRTVACACSGEAILAVRRRGGAGV